MFNQMAGQKEDENVPEYPDLLAQVEKLESEFQKTELQYQKHINDLQMQILQKDNEFLKLSQILSNLKFVASQQLKRVEAMTGIKKKKSQKSHIRSTSPKFVNNQSGKKNLNSEKIVSSKKKNYSPENQNFDIKQKAVKKQKNYFTKREANLTNLFLSGDLGDKRRGRQQKGKELESRKQTTKVGVSNFREKVPIFK